MNSTYVALNVFANRDCTTEYPIVFYLNKEDNVIEYLKSESKFIQYIESKCLNVENYTDSRICYIYLNVDESYEQKELFVQDFIMFKDMSQETSSFFIDYVKTHFNYLYKCSYKTEYEFDENPLNANKDILDIYDKIKEKHPNKVIKSTVLNYIRSQLIKENNLSNENSAWIINKLEDLIND